MATTSAYLFGSAKRPRDDGRYGGRYGRRQRRRLWLLAAALLLVTPFAKAAWPPDESHGTVDYSAATNWPSDPDYANEWQAWSFAPKVLTKLDDRSRRLGTGGHSDQAWAKSIGDPRVVIAVLDSGAEWENRDLVNKWFLNAGELPPPDDACQKPENRGPGKRLYDANGDGVFNVQDYTTVRGHAQPDIAHVCDPRVSDVNHNGLVDPQDLIAAFSDKVDDDHNGYVDDIAGWDFFHNDNDPSDDTRFGHGTSEAGDSAAEADNGISGTGGCPLCRVIPLRVGDSFVADANDFAVAAAYAVDIGAAVIQEALGAIDNTPLSKWAIDYAYDNHVAVVASAADENSFHHNFPGTNNHTLYVHAIRYNADNLPDATNVFAFNNCTNYGAQLLLSVPGTGCSSEATGRTAGMVGLLYSAALSANLPAPPRLHPPSGGDTAPAGDGGPVAQRVRRLSAEEVRQILVGSADHFYDPAEDHTLDAYPSGPGFVRRFGYGRTNARSAVDRVLSGAIPPEVEIAKPEWFQVLSRLDGRVPIVGRIAVRDPSDSYDFEVAWAPGVDPKENLFRTIGSGDMQQKGIEGRLTDISVFDITVNNPVLPRDDPSWQPDDAAHIYTLTVRVRATQHSMDPQRNGLISEARRAIHINFDQDLLTGFPKRLGASGEASPKTADLLGDGKREIIVADSGGLLHALRADGSELPGWPVQAPTIPALAGDASGHASAPAWSAPPGQPRPGFGSAILATPAVGDINGDGRLDVVAATFDGQLFAVGADGKLLPGFPVHVDGVSAQLSIDSRHVLDDGFFAAPVLGDLDRDGKLDIIAAAMDGQIYVFRGDGSPMPGWPLVIWDSARPDMNGDPQPRQRQRIVSTPALGDLNGDGILDLVLGTNEQYDETGRVYAVDGRGSRAPSAILPGWPASIPSRYVLPVIGSGIPNAVALGDVDGDGKPEIFVNGIASNLIVLKSDGQLFGTNLQGGRQGFGALSDAQEFATLGFIGSPALGDLDGDGSLDAVLPTAGANAALSMAKNWQRLDFEMHLSAWDVKSGQQKPGFPRVMEDYLFFMNALIVDVDADGKKEAVAGSAGYFIHAWNSDGKEAAGFPKFTGGWVAATPTVGDLDGDGRLEMVSTTRDGWLFAWHIKGKARGRMDWDSFHHDSRNTGNLAEKLDQGGDEFDPPAMMPPTEMLPVDLVDQGCACSIGHAQSNEPLASLFALLVLAYYLRQRRRLLKIESRSVAK